MKHWKHYAALAATALVTLGGFTACGDDETSDPTAPGGTNNDPALSVTDQKKRIESVASELMAKVNSDDYKNLNNIYQVIYDANGEQVDDWAQAAAEACKQPGSTNTNLKYLYTAANFTGRFALSHGVWVKTDDKIDYLEFTGKDEAGKTFALTLKTSGKQTPIHHDSFDDDDVDYIWSESEYDYDRVETHTRNAFTLPQNISLTLTQDGKKVAGAEVVSNVTIASGEEVDLTRDKVDVSATAMVNDITVKVEKAAFNAGTDASTKVTVTKGSETLVAAQAQAEGKVTESDATIGKGNFVINVLSKMRIEGKTDNGAELDRYLNLADKNDEDESLFKKYVAKANEQLDVKIFFDNSKNSSASIVLYPLEENDYYGSYWYYEPYFAFNDGTKYSFEEYFEEGTFKSVVTQFNNLLESFADLFRTDE